MDLIVTQPAADAESLPRLLSHAAAALANAKNSAELLQAHALASVAYDMASNLSRLARAKSASDTLVTTAHHVMADAIAIECTAQSRLADEYSNAIERGEVARQGHRLQPGKVTLREVGITRGDLWRARLVHGAEAAQPGIVRKTLDDALARGQAPLKSIVWRAIHAATAAPKLAANKSLSPLEECKLRVRNVVARALRGMAHEAQVRLLREVDRELGKLRRRYVEHPKISPEPHN